MENAWEYDYSDLYRGGAAQPENGPSSTVPPTPTEPVPEPPKHHKGRGKKIALRVVSLLLVAAIAFGAGYLGSYVGLQVHKNDLPAGTRYLM